MRKHVGWLLLIPIMACLVPALFNRRTPTLAGIPFFYWGQLMLVPVAALAACLVVLLQRDDKPGGRK